MRTILEPGVELGGFVLRERMHAGSMASLWRVERAGDPTPMAMKLPRVRDGDDPAAGAADRLLERALGELDEGIVRHEGGIGALALLGGILGILPVVEVRDGVVTSVAKVRGDRAGMQTLLDFLEKMPPDPAYGICFGHADDEARLEKYLTFLRPHLHGLQIHTSSLGSVIGTHTGPGLVGIAYVLAEQ